MPAGGRYLNIPRDARELDFSLRKDMFCGEDMYLLLADAVIVFHFLFIVFVVAGGLLVLRRPRLAFLHLPAAFWGAFIEFSGGICPLTPLENHLRLLGGGSRYSGDFIVQYLIPVIYPANLTVSIQYVLGGVVIAANLMVYLFIIRKKSFFSRVKDKIRGKS
jgi:hypothetical protein